MAEATTRSAYAVDRLAARVSELAGAPVELERPPEAELGDYATNVALRTAKERGRPPRELAAELAGLVVGLDEVERAEVAGPGFLNIFVTDDFLAKALAEVGPEYGAGSAQQAERVQVEFVSANPTGPLTVASARNGAYGDSVARLLAFAGHDVEREYYYNDAGRQMELFRESVAAIRRGEDPPADGYRGEYMHELVAVDGDPVPAMLQRIEETLERFRIHFDTWALQSALASEIPAAIEQISDTFEGEGTLWARTSAHGDDKDRPLIRSTDGSYLYFAADAAYMLDKFRRGFERLMYVLGHDHHAYLRRLKALAALLGQDPDRIEVLLYQLVTLTKYGEQAKMSKRSGDVVFLEELIDEVGVDAARWYLIDRGHDQAIEIDVDLAKEKSRKNPVYYVQYSHARASGIFREAGDVEVDPVPIQPLEREERELVKRLAEFPGVVAEATERRGPHAIPIYAIRLADDFHRFYQEHTVLAEKGGTNQAFRLALVKATQDVIARSLDLVGVEAPERM